MNELEQKIKQEVIDLHDLFVQWFTGKFDKIDLKNKLASYFHKDVTFITTQGESINYKKLITMFDRGYGINPSLRIVISDVEILQEIGDCILANYIEWQTNDPKPHISGNYSIRKTTLLISNKAPFKWLHIHETMMPKPIEIIEDWIS